MTKGDIILIVFPFTDLNGSKLRPAVILASSSRDVTVCFITSQTHLYDITDIMLLPDLMNGLKKQSLVKTSKIATIDKSLVKGIIGNLSPQEITDLNVKLKTVLQIP